MAYIPRLTKEDIEISAFWNTLINPFYPEYKLPNCTCYAWGRFWEISSVHVPTLPTGNGGTWWNEVVGYQKGSTPALGAVACFSKDGEAGHVGIVEIIEDDVVTLSNSNYYRDTTSGFEYEANLFYLKTVADIINEGFTFQGYIYNPYADGPIPPITKHKKKGFKWSLYQNKIRKIIN